MDEDTIGNIQDEEVQKTDEQHDALDDEQEKGQGDAGD